MHKKIVEVCIVDDHPLVLEGISTVLRQAGYAVESARDIPEASLILRRSGPFDILLLDHNLPSGKGSDLLNDPTVPLPPHVAILSAMTDPDDILFALEKTSAKAYIHKHIDLPDLAHAVGQLPDLPPLSHDAWIWDVPGRRYIAAQQFFPRNSVLTPREREILMLVRQGLADKQIADRLHRSIHTVRVQIRTVKRKRGHTRRGEIHC